MRTITDKIDAVTGMRPDQHHITPPCPKSVKIELTGRCNLRCSFCATSYNLRDKKDMDKDFYLKLLKDLKQAGVEEVGMFFLGESMMLPWLPWAIREAKKAGIGRVFLTTNGTACSKTKLQDCMEAGLDSLKFSLNYADADQFAEVAQVKKMLFYNLVQAVKDAHFIRENGGYDCGVYASYIRYDGEQGERMQKLIDELSTHTDEIYALPLYSQADLTGQENADRGWNVRAGNPGRADAMREPLPCWSLFSEARVTWDGRLAGCCFDHDARFDMGDLTKVSFMEAWHSKKFSDLRGWHLKKSVGGTACEDCVAYQ